MDSMLMFESYQRYKSGTKQLVIWLVEKSAKPGYKFPAIPNERSETSNRQRQKNKNGGSQLPKPVPTEYTLSATQFPALARQVAAYGIKTPSWVLNLVQDVIKERRSAAAFWAAQNHQADQNIKDSNDRHLHFIIILEEVLDIMRKNIDVPGANIETKVASDKPSCAEKSDLSVTRNAFGSLDIEEPSEAFQTSGSMVEKTKHKTSDAPTILELYEPEMNEEEVLFQVYAFFNDFSEIRKLLHQAWVSYEAGGLDLAAIATLTNTAFVLFERMEMDLIYVARHVVPIGLFQTPPGGSRYEFILNHFIINSLVDSSGRRFNHFVEQGDPFNIHMYGLADAICFMPSLVLIDYAHSLESSGSTAGMPNIPIWQRGPENTLTPEHSTLRQQLKQQQRVLEDLVQEIALTSCMGIDGMMMPGQDELTKGTLELTKTRVVPIWLILAYQIHLDVHALFPKSMSHGQKELMKTGIRASISLQNYFNNELKVPRFTWPRSHVEEIIECKKYVEKWIKKDLMAASRNIIAQHSTLQKSSGEAFLLLRSHPILCGTMSMMTQVLLQDRGILMANAFGNIQSCAHLYNAIRSSIKSMPLWPDMEALIAYHTEEAVFKGARPTHLKDCFRRYSLMMGFSVTAFAAKRRHEVPQLHNRGTNTRGMLHRKRLSEIYFSQHCSEEAEGEKILQGIERMILGQVMSRKGIPANKQPALINSLLESRDLPALLVLRTLGTMLKQESFSMHFDYFAMHVRCTAFLRGLATKCYEELKEWFLDGEISDHLLPQITHRILLFASGECADLHRERGGEGMVTELLVAAEREMREFVVREGDLEERKRAKILGRV